MKSNQKGFTLIELLAVIVILAIIALIATPIVLNIINKAKKSAAADSVYGVMEAMKLAYTESLLDDGYEMPLVVTFPKMEMQHGDPAKDVMNGSAKATLKVSGTAPTAGTLTLNDGTFTAEGLVVNGINCEINDGKVTCGGKKADTPDTPTE